MNQIKSLFLLLGAVFLHFQSMAQVMLLQESFETDGRGIRYETELDDNPALRAWWGPTNLNPAPQHAETIGAGTRAGSWYWAGENTKESMRFRFNKDGFVTLNALNVSSYKLLDVQIALGMSRFEENQWTKDNFIMVEYNMDDTGWNIIGLFRGNNPTAEFGGQLKQDTDNNLATFGPFGTEVTGTFADFTFPIPVTGTSLQVRVRTNCWRQQEFGFDNIRIRGILCPSLTFGAAATTTCPGTSNGTIIIVDPAGGTAPYLYSINNGASYQSSATFPNLAAGTYQARIKDANGCESVVINPTIEARDNIAPTISCPGTQTEFLDASCEVLIPNYTGLATASDNCGALSISQSPPAGTVIQGPITVTLSAQDNGGLTSSCTFTVEPKDAISPDVVCPADITVRNDPGLCSAVVDFSPASASDNCDNNLDISYSQDPGTAFDVGTTTVTITVKDDFDNPDDCSFSVTVNDTEVPTFSNCPDPINLFNDEEACGAVATWTPPVFEDNCPEESFNSTHIPGAFFPVGTTTVTYSGSDKAGNQAIDCSFTVSVTDIEKPKIACPGDISTGTDPGVCGAQVNFTPAIASDNCEVDEVKARYRPVDENGSAIGSWTSRVVDPSGFFPVGRYQVQWRAEDIYGNKRTCSQYLDVFDDEDPVAVCKNLTIDFNGQQDISLSVSQVWDEAASSDNCGYVEFVAADLTIGCEELGNTVALPVTIQDEAGNEDDCTAYVDVIGLPCGWSEGPDDGSLNCDGQTTSDYDVDDESFTLNSDGCWHDCREADKATYVYHPLCGDGTLTAELASINTSGYAGLMARESLNPLARRAGVLKNYSTRRVRREWRASYGGIVSQSNSNRSRVKWLRIVRKGNEIKSYTSTNGSYWRLLYKTTFSNLEDCIYVGMMAYSLNGSAEVRAVFENVTLSGSGTLAGGIIGDPATITPKSLQAWGTAGDVGNGTIEVFPNPAADQAQLILEDFQDKPAQLMVRDAFGKIVRQIDLDSAMGVVMPLEVHNLAPGVYIISLIQDQQLMGSKRLLVQP